MSADQSTDRPEDDPAEPSDLVAWGRVCRLRTRGRRTGRIRSVDVGFVEEPDGSLLVAANDPDADWALNLLADPRCEATIGSLTRACRAERLDEAAASRAVAELILRYGTPSERLGSGPAFRLVPITGEPQTG